MLSFWDSELALELPARFAPYHQVFQAILDPYSPLAANAGGVNALLIRLEDWAAAGDAAPAQFVDALRGSAAAAEWIVLLCPPSAAWLDDPSRAAWHSDQADFLRRALASLPAVHFADSGEVLDLYPVDDVADAAAESLGRVPYTAAFFAALATWIARKAHALRMPPFKVLALDCDNTLWDGICGEDGPAGVVVSEPRLALQRFALAQRDAGLLLALCSKNNEADVFDAMSAHPEMPLRPEHITAWRIDWENKSDNLAALAADLELGLDSFIFLDDDRRECAEVVASCPAVLTLQLPPDPSTIPVFLRHVWAFDHARITDADRHRAEQYSQRAERQRAARHAGSLAEFLSGIQLEVHIAAPSPDSLPRVAQLTQRTNQMNTGGPRYAESDLGVALAAGAIECLAVDVSDRFGDYGLVGVMLFRTHEAALHVETFLLSCRALGRGVEHRMLAHLGQLAVERGLARVELAFTSSPRNAPARSFLDSLGVPPREGLYTLPAAIAASTVWKAPDAPAALSAPSEPKPAATRRFQDYLRIANSLRTVDGILAAARGRRGQAQPRAIAPADLPQGETEQRLAALWSELLAAHPIGRHESFFDLGGHSLLAVQLLSRIGREFGVDLTLDVVYGGPLTIAELARAIELGGLEIASPEEYEALLREIEAMPDEEVRAQLEAAQRGPNEP